MPHIDGTWTRLACMKANAKFTLLGGALLALATIGLFQMVQEQADDLRPVGTAAEVQEQATPETLEASGGDSRSTSSTVEVPLRRETLETQVQMETVRGTVLNEEGGLVQAFTLTANYRPSVKSGVKWQERELGPFGGGHFELTNLEAGYWRIQPKSDRHTGHKRASFKTPYSGEELVLHLTRLALVQGTVWLPNQTPAIKATVMLRSAGKPLKTTTDEQGRFEILHLPGNFECLARHPIFASSAVLKGQSSVELAQDLDLQLRAGGTLVGEALGLEGDPLVNWRVDVRSLTWELEPRDSQTDETGAFEFAHLSPGDYWVEAVRDVTQESRQSAVRSAFQITSGETTRVTLGGLNPDAITVHGTVFLDGEPAPEVTVVCKLEGGKSFATTYQAKTHSDGTFEYTLPGSGPANFLVIFEAGRLCPIPVNLTAERNQQIDLHIPEGSIGGRVVQTGSKPKKKIRVKCIPEDRSPLHSSYLSRTVSCDESGAFRFDHLPAGSYRIGVLDTMQADAVIESVLLDANGSVGGLELRTGDSVRAKILVLDSEGRPVADAEIFALNHQGTMFGSNERLRTSSRGTLKLRQLGMGEYRFFARKGDSSSLSSDPIMVTGKAGEPIQLTLLRGARGEIQVMDSDQPVPARLWIVNSSGDDFSATLQTFDIGKYIREGNNSSKYDVGPLPPGIYQVRARALDGRTTKGVLKLNTSTIVALELQL